MNYMAVHAAGHQTTSPWTIGFATFAGALMFLAGTFQVFQGLAAIFSGDFFVVGQEYIYTLDVTTWGWIHLFIGVVVAIAGLSIFSGNAWGRGLGIVLAVVSAIANFFYIPYYPVWSMLIIALNIAVIWALASYGPEEAESLN